jgi:cell division protease FtsH
MPEADRRLITKSKFEDDIAQALGGREAEKLVFGETSTGAENDLGKATKIAHDMVRVYGMSDKLGPIQYGHREEMVFLGRDFGDGQKYSEKIAAELDDEIRVIVLRAEKVAGALLRKHRKLLDTISKKLIKQETIDRDEFAKLVGATI